MPALRIEDLPKLDIWLRSLLWDSELPVAHDRVESTGAKEVEFEIHRLKARIPLTDGSLKVIQGVREIFEVLDAPSSPGGSKGDTAAKLVIIGRNIEKLPFRVSLLDALGASRD